MSSLTEEEDSTKRLAFLLSYLPAITGQQAQERLDGTIEKCKENNLHIYKCIERAMFALPRITQNPFYSLVLPLFPTSSLLELGCCFGVDVRQLVKDGLRAEKTVVSDVHDGYWKIGKSVLFKGEAAPNWGAEVFGDLTGTKDLVKDAGWAGKFDIVSAQAILHVLSKKQCHTFLINVQRTLKPGGVFFGTSVMAQGEALGFEWGDLPTIANVTTAMTDPRYLYTSSELQKLLQKLGFKEIKLQPLNHTSSSTKGALGPSAGVSEDEITHNAFYCIRV